MKPTFYANWFELTELSDDSATRMMNRNEQRCRVGRFSFFLRILLVWCVASWRRVTQFGGISCGWWKQQSSNNGQSQSVWTENVSLFFWGKTLSNVASNGKSLRTNLNFWRDTSRDGWSIGWLRRIRSTLKWNSNKIWEKLSQWMECLLSWSAIIGFD